MFALIALALVVVAVFKVRGGRRQAALRPEPDAPLLVPGAVSRARGPRYRFRGSGGSM
jgi:hypothetical protein